MGIIRLDENFEAYRRVIPAVWQNPNIFKDKVTMVGCFRCHLLHPPVTLNTKVRGKSR